MQIILKLSIPSLLAKISIAVRVRPRALCWYWQTNWRRLIARSELGILRAGDGTPTQTFLPPQPEREIVQLRLEHEI